MADVAWATCLAHLGQKDEAGLLLRETQKALEDRPYDGPHYQNLVRHRMQMVEDSYKASPGPGAESQ